MPRPGTGTVDLSYFWRHPVRVQRYTGESAFGAQYDAPATVTGLVDDGQRIVAGPKGQEITSSATVLLPIETPIVPVQSKVTLPVEFGERTGIVVAISRRDAGGIPLPEFWEVSLQ